MSRRVRNEKVEAALRGARFGHKWIRITCPFCADDGHNDRKRSLGVSSATGRYECFRCGSRGRLQAPPDPVAARDVDEALKREFKAMEPPPGFCVLADEPAYSSLAYQPAKGYLISRGLKSRKFWRELQIGVSDYERWNGRILIPMLDTEGEEWLGWIGRLWVRKPAPAATGFAEMKYLYPSGMVRGLSFWNHTALRIEEDAPALTVEGAFDAIPFWPDAAAFLGKASEEQIEALVCAKRPICTVLDGDAWREAWVLTQRLRFEGQRAGYVRLPPRVDPDEVPRSWLLEEARKSLDRPI